MFPEKNRRLTMKELNQLVIEFEVMGRATRRTMYGGQAIYINEVVFALFIEHQVYFKVGPANLKDFKEIKSYPLVYENKKRRIVTSYWLFPSEICDQTKELLRWAEKSLNVSKENQRPKPLKKRRRLLPRSYKPEA